MKKKDGSYKFTAEDFWKLIEQQDYRCKLTNLPLTELNCTVELRSPKIVMPKRAELSNHYLIDRAFAHMARYLTEDEIIEKAIQVVRFRGAEKGYRLTKVAKKK